jgi:hypothetical protein
MLLKHICQIIKDNIGVFYSIYVLLVNAKKLITPIFSFREKRLEKSTTFSENKTYITCQIFGKKVNIALEELGFYSLLLLHT